MSASARVLQVLELFSEKRGSLRAAEVVKSLGVSTATAYRYLAELEEAGLVERASGNEYVLGTKVVELDRVIRENDPLVVAAEDIMKALSEQTGATALLCRLHGHKVMCVHQVRGRLGPPTVSYQRGKAMSLFRGAASKVIFARLPHTVLEQIAASQADELREGGFSSTWSELRAELAMLREHSVLASRDEMDPVALGWSVAIEARKKLLGSLSLVLYRAADPIHTVRLSEQLRRAVLQIEARLED